MLYVGMNETFSSSSNDVSTNEPAERGREGGKENCCILGLNFENILTVVVLMMVVCVDY